MQFPSVAERFAKYTPAIALIVCALATGARAGDWPVFRADNNRGGCTADALAFPLTATWEYRFPQRPRPAWPEPAEELPRVHGDNAFHVVLAGGRAFFGSSVHDCVYALDAATGQPAWTFPADGPVRFPPAVSGGRVYFGSDDGYVYCLNAADGSLVWKYRPGPTSQKALCSGRMISSWPVRTGLLVDGTQVLGAAGVFPYEGVYVFALNASDGKVIWQNDAASAPAHNLPFGGIAPHGQLVATKDLLFVPSGRATPAAYDRKTGELAFCVPTQGKQGGTWIALDGERLLSGDESSGDPSKVAFDAHTGAAIGRPFEGVTGEIDVALAPGAAHVVTRQGISTVDRAAYDRTQGEIRTVKAALTARQAEYNRLLRRVGFPTGVPAPDVLLSDLKATKAVVGFGELKKDTAVMGGPLKIAGKVYARGMGVHAESELVYPVQPAYRAFVATVGIDAGSAGHASLSFEVWIDGTMAAQTPVFRGQGGPWHFCVPLPRTAKAVRLIVTNGGDDNGWDHGDWVDAGFVTDPAKPLPTLRPDEKTAATLGALASETQGLRARLAQLQALRPVRSHARPGLCSVIRAGNAVIAGGDGVVVALDAATDRELWQAKVDGRAVGLAVSDGRLVVSTDTGRVYCFGQPLAGRKACLQVMIGRKPPVTLGRTLLRTCAAEAEAIVATVGNDKGYCLIDGFSKSLRSGDLAVQLAVKTKWRILGLERDPVILARVRDRMAAMGLLGDRVAVEPWTAAELPDYFANVIVSEEKLLTLTPETAPAEWGRLLRPGGGAAVFCAAGADGKVTARKTVRPPLEGAGRWTAQYGNAGNTGCSDDTLVKGPFSVLWYGEPGGVGMVERHARASAPLAGDGRLFIPTQDGILACDAYNGTLLWRRTLPGSARIRVDADGGHLALAADGLYVVARDTCYRLDLATGETLKAYPVPADPKGGPRRWGYMGVAGGVLYGTASRPLAGEVGQILSKHVDGATGKWRPLTPEELADPKRIIGKTFIETYPEPNADALKAMQRRGILWKGVDQYGHWVGLPDPTPPSNVLKAGETLFAIDPASGQLLWQYEGRQIVHITVAIDKARVYFAQRCPDELLEAATAARAAATARGLYHDAPALAPDAKPGKADLRLLTALDAKTGAVVWQKPFDVTGSGGDMMGAAVKDGVLVLLGHFSNHDTGAFLKDRLTWRRITAIDATSGELLWSKSLNYLRRPLIQGDRILIEPRACELRTGNIVMRTHPVTGEKVPWEFLRPGHSCGISSASAYTVFYRSGCAAFLDVAADAGLSLFGAMRPGCWINTVSAGGLALIPEASSGCTCSFPIRSSVALAPRASRGGDQAVFITHGPSGASARRLAVSFGATGDVRDEKGQLWLAYPRPAANSGVGYGPYGLPLDLRERLAAATGYFRQDVRRPSAAEGFDAVLAASGCAGMRHFDMPLVADGEAPRTYRITLGLLARPEDKPGQRVFDVKVGSNVLKGVDVAATAPRGRLQGVSFDAVPVAGALAVELIPHKAGPDAAPIICFAEAVATGKEPSQGADAAASEWDRTISPILGNYGAVAPGAIRGLVAGRLELWRKLSPGDPSRAARALAPADAVLGRVEDQELTAQVRRALGYVTDWTLLGPVALPEAVQAPGESLEQGRADAADSQAGKPHRADNAKVNFAEALGHNDHAGAYARVRFDLPEAKELRIHVTADDAFKAWLNGKPAGQTLDPYGPTDKERVIWGDGAKGANTLLIYVPNLGGHWTLQVRLTDREGVPVTTKPTEK